jgi:hypothetical protein
MSLRKDVVDLVTIHKVPPHLSKEEFETRLSKLHDELLAVPAFERNIVKLETLVQNDGLDSRLETLGCPPREELVVVRWQAKSADNIVALWTDPDLLTKIDGAPDLELKTRSNTFSVDIQPVMDLESDVDPKDRLRFLWVYKIPEHISKEQYEPKFHKFFEDYAAYPLAQKNYVKLEKWVPNDALQDHLHLFGNPPPEPTFISYGEFENWENVNAVTEREDTTTVKVILDAKRDFDFNTHASASCVDVVTKLDRS